MLQHAMAAVVSQHLEEVKREIKIRMLRKANFGSRRHAELQLQAEAQITVKAPTIKGGVLSR